MRRDRLGLGDSMGVVSLAFAAGSVEYPISREELIEEMGHRKIQWTKSKSIDLERVLREMDQDEFESFVDVLSAVSHYRDEREESLAEFL